MLLVISLLCETYMQHDEGLSAVYRLLSSLVRARMFHVSSSGMHMKEVSNWPERSREPASKEPGASWETFTSSSLSGFRVGLGLCVQGCYKEGLRLG